MGIQNKIKSVLKSCYIKAYQAKRRRDDNNFFKKYIKSRKISHKDYWKKYDKHYSNISHNFYYEKTGHDSKYYIPDSFYYSVIDIYYNDIFSNKFLDDKNLYDKYFYNINQPITLAKKINNQWLINDSLVNLKEVLNSISNLDEVVCKKTKSSCGGKGVFFVKKENYSSIDNLGDNLIIQKPISQCDELNKLCQTSINTIRVMSVIDDNKVEILSVIIRFGLEGSRVDNASSGGLTCGVKENGELKDVAFKPDGEKFIINPNTNEKFSDVKIPNFSKLMDLTRKCHSQFPFYKLISRDWAIDQDNEPVLIEGNFFVGELDFHQLNNGPLFGDKTDYYLNKITKR